MSTFRKDFPSFFWGVLLPFFLIVALLYVLVLCVGQQTERELELLCADHWPGFESRVVRENFRPVCQVKYEGVFYPVTNPEKEHESE